MFARATSGDKMNNRNFSPCSLKSVKRVLQAKARGSKGCFTGKFASTLLTIIVPIILIIDLLRLDLKGFAL